MQKATTDGLGRLSLSDIKSKSNDVTFALKFTLYAALIGMGGWMALNEHIGVMLGGMVLLGCMFAHGVELQHQVLHAQGFRNKKLNEWIGVLLGLPMLVSFAEYRASHMHHHRFLGTPQNEEFFDYGDQYGKLSLRSLSSMLIRLFMLTHYLRLLRNMFFSLTSEHRKFSLNVSRRIKRDHIAMLLMIAMLSLLSAEFGVRLVLCLWLLPLLFIAAPIHALIEMPEHFRCATDSTDPFQNTRTIKSNAFMNWFTNGNNYHVEHHYMPGLPIDRLHDLHETIHQRCAYVETSYTAFYSQLLKSAFKR
ncbi:fatty acid desaturase family protein [Pseudomonas cremoricolorata]|uniref:Fatty acid desaturase n=1 Tax=Pseudomonas cremoricolorata TaxID=157783 RepID=A0A089YDL0_9PSED|nr:fatty acid desaturase [Pseudomonas cremoricolorata]AIR89858.1 fatty acid desaturase [Pseudomonas cremoricolorata]